ncbi:glucosaminidase domain-containing protein [Nitrosophilus alvini]|uniref:glucosaminidase domain-containing protein n=1 Tax=Nitrosophilus alvini TaxID=2714855 RepID=UPI001F318718|nr:glucosaminidase domain-containing protein [Nitrosophilus alvini]
MKRVLLTGLGIVLSVKLMAADYKSIPEWYYNIKNINTQKEKFFEILTPLVKKENQKILEERRFIKNFFNEMFKYPKLPENKLKRLVKIAKKYRIKNIYNKDEYLKKIDIIPQSLVLAQAALESGWGKSRFAKEANNLFGEWTFGKRGLIPQEREEGKKHKIKVFGSISASIASYMLNLNRHAAYREFRQARYIARKEGRKFTGLQAAMTMQRYSQIGKKYNRLVVSIIKKNRLHHLETPRG